VRRKAAKSARSSSANRSSRNSRMAPRSRKTPGENEPHRSVERLQVRTIGRIVKAVAEAKGIFP
jgi:hypothetical protein